MEIKIIKSRKETYWYNNYIGKVFTGEIYHDGSCSVYPIPAGEFKGMKGIVAVGDFVKVNGFIMLRSHEGCMSD